MADRIQGNIPLLFSEHICHCSAVFLVLLFLPQSYSHEDPDSCQVFQTPTQGCCILTPSFLRQPHLKSLRAHKCHGFCLCHFGHDPIAWICTAGDTQLLMSKTLLISGVGENSLSSSKI